MGLVGGGPGAFIGPVHRIAAELDRDIELVAGAFSSDASRSLDAGRGYRIDPSRAYADVETLIAAERLRPDGVDFLAIVTPNHLHLPAARLALEAGLSVMSDKPATATLAEARALAGIVSDTGGHYALSYTYTGYPMVRQARALIADGVLGRVTKVVVEYLQGWLAEPIERGGNKQASWRVDPQKAGLGGCIGDIGVHAFNLAEFVTGARVNALASDLGTVVADRVLDDDCTLLLGFENEARGVLLASQIATGERNGLSLRIYGDKAALLWRQEEPDRLMLTGLDGRSEIQWAGGAALGPDARSATRLPAGHPEGYLEAFGTLYRDFAVLLRGGDAPLLPGIAEGVRSMAFVDLAVAANGRGWVALNI